MPLNLNIGVVRKTQDLVAMVPLPNPSALPMVIKQIRKRKYHPIAIHLSLKRTSNRCVLFC